MGKSKEGKSRSILEMIEDKLASLGVEIEKLTSDCEDDKVKVIGIGIGLKDAVRAMGETPRDHVLMVRVDEDTQTKLDDWVETGAVKSRSEAAALFIREGLMLRASELDQLRAGRGGGGQTASPQTRGRGVRGGGGR